MNIFRNYSAGMASCWKRILLVSTGSSILARACALKKAMLFLDGLTLRGTRPRGRRFKGSERAPLKNPHAIGWQFPAGITEMVFPLAPCQTSAFRVELAEFPIESVFIFGVLTHACCNCDGW